MATRDKVRSRKWTSGFAAAAPDVGDEFPHDDLAPDDFPVRDVSEDQEEPQPAPHVRTKSAGRPVHAFNNAIRGRGGEGVAPAPTHTGQQASTSDIGQEPTPEIVATPPQANADHPKQSGQGRLPGLEPDHATGFEPGSRERQTFRSRRKRTPARDKLSKATQMALWPDDLTSIAHAEPLPPNPSKKA